ncbi:hypothetical protein ABZV77_23660 [Streptomyces sp. NPDC004732]|uniref:hypothetical protein n=1 Tax=Streptomyces sp. NPDC004732 TaxID=3154290 RepID=UPI0033AAA07B
MAAAPGEIRPVFYAPYGNINAGSVHGGQRVGDGSADERAAERTWRHEGPIPEDEVADAAFGFAEPDQFGRALDALQDGVLFLAGGPGSGRRTMALNLLRRSCGDADSLQALDTVTDLDRWRPTQSGARGYLVHGLFPSHPLRPGMLGNLRSLLGRAGARMVIVLPDDPYLLRDLEQDLHVQPVRCEPPLPRVVFDARLRASVPDGAERARLLGALEPGLLAELLVPGLVPAEVAELVTAVVAADGDPAALVDLRDRLSFRAEQEVPELLHRLRDDPDGLAFLLATCVFEGLDHRVVRAEADRLLEIADGRLTSLPTPTDAQQGGGQEAPRQPRFVFRRSLSDLLHAVRARRKPREIRTYGAYAHTVEPVTFIRHRQAEAVLRHVWREYGQLSELLVTWLGDVHRHSELTRPVGQVMGMAAGWGGGRGALQHIRKLAGADRATSRLIAAHALGLAAEDPVLVAEVRHRLNEWSVGRSPRLRTTVAYACGAEFGVSRPEFALRLLRALVTGVADGPDEDAVRLAVRAAVLRLFRAGNERRVFEQLTAWTAVPALGSEPLHLLPQLLQEPHRFQKELTGGTANGLEIVALTRAALNADATFDATSRAVLRWCHAGQWDDALSRAAENLLAALAGSMEHGVLRLFVEVDRDASESQVGRAVARRALEAWRAGETGRSADRSGEFDDRTVKVETV